jgi:hypothetical protein
VAAWRAAGPLGEALRRAGSRRGGGLSSRIRALGVAPVLSRAKYDAPSHYSIIYVAKPVEIVSGCSVLLGCWGAFGWNPFRVLGHVYGMLGHVWTASTPAFANHTCMFWIF